ncbi:MAG: hypothetical protein GY814_13970 [Gammaproteobacteria bacterium]|nr:hypothetical protein [Gammaproteobacteria bacterium]
MSANNNFNPVGFIQEVGSHLIRARVEQVLEDKGSETSVAFDHYCDAMTLVENIGFSTGCGELNWCADDFLRAYPEFKWVYSAALQEGQQSREINALQAASTNREGKVTVFCPRGCNQTDAWASAPWAECAACGSIMREHSEDSYYGALTMSGQVM